MLDLYNAAIALWTVKCNNTSNTKMWSYTSCGKAKCCRQVNYGICESWLCGPCTHHSLVLRIILRFVLCIIWLSLQLFYFLVFGFQIHMQPYKMYTEIISVIIVNSWFALRPLMQEIGLTIQKFGTCWGWALQIS